MKLEDPMSAKIFMSTLKSKEEEMQQEPQTETSYPNQETDALTGDEEQTGKQKKGTRNGTPIQLPILS